MKCKCGRPAEVQQANIFDEVEDCVVIVSTR